MAPNARRRRDSAGTRSSSLDAKADSSCADESIGHRGGTDTVKVRGKGVSHEISGRGSTPTRTGRAHPRTSCRRGHRIRLASGGGVRCRAADDRDRFERGQAREPGPLTGNHPPSRRGRVRPGRGRGSGSSVRTRPAQA